MKKCLPILVVLAMATVANAAISTDFVGTPVTLPTAGTPLIANSMQVTTDSEWLNSYIDITLSFGSFYETPVYGGDTEPNPAFVTLVPDLAYDSYLDTPGPYSTADLASFAPGKTVSPTMYNVSWFDDANFPDGPGTFQVAQFTLTPDAMGTVVVRNFDTQSAGEGVWEYQWSVEDGYIVPEPATLALLASGGICVLLRKKR